METFIYILMCILSLIGISTLIRGLIYVIFKFDLSEKAVTVIFLDDKTYEITIRSAAEQIKWKKGIPKNIIAVDNGLSRSAKREAKMLLNDYNIMLCEKDEIFNNLRDRL